jgi:sec-independent protein translocase protein TatB
MFGIGGTEIIVILLVALIFVGPDKLPEAAKAISKGIRDIKRSTRDIQSTIENDEHIGGAIRDLKSALRDEPAPLPPMAPRDSAKVLSVAAGDITEPSPSLEAATQADNQAVLADNAAPVVEAGADTTTTEAPADDGVKIRPHAAAVPRGASLTSDDSEKPN